MGTLPPSVKPNWLLYFIPLSARLSSIFFLRIVHIILLLFTVTAIGLCSRILGLLFFGIIVVLDTSQSWWTSSVIALLKHFNMYCLASLSFNRAFITSAGILSTPDALLFFMLLTVSTSSFSVITGYSIIPEFSSVIISSIFFLIPVFLSDQNEKSVFLSFWYTCFVHLSMKSLLHVMISFLSPCSVKI